MTYIPRKCDLVYLQEKDEKQLSIALLVRQATREDKIEYVLRVRKALQLQQLGQLQRHSLKKFFKEEKWIVLQGEEVLIVSRDQIVSLAARNE